MFPFIISFIIAIVFILLWRYFLIYFIFGECKSKRRLDGKTVIITGGNSGIGYETAKDLAFRGARVIITSEKYSDCINAKYDLIRLTKNENIEAKYLDFRSFENVRNFAKDILKTEEKIDILINNAGTLGNLSKMTKDGIISGLQINFFGPFLLTHLLVDLIKKSKSSRIVNVASIASFVESWRVKKIEQITIDDPNCYYEFQVYCLSKLCVVFMTWEMSRRLKHCGVTVNCVHPGVVNSGFLQPYSFLLYFILRIFMKTTKQGAQTSIHCAVSEDVENVTGEYFADCKIFKPHLEKERQLTKELWDLSIKAVKLKDDEIKL